MEEKRVAIYGRVSTMSQNIESQLLPLREYCQRNGLKVFREYLEQGVSGAKSSRPELTLMMDDIRDGKVDIVLIFKLDRLGRSLSHLLDLLGEFRNRKIRLISVSDSLDTTNDNPMSRAFWQLLGVFSEFERALIRERVIVGLVRAKKEGRRLGRPKGVKDSRRRSVSGYVRRYAGTTKEQRKIGPRRRVEDRLLREKVV